MIENKEFEQALRLIKVLTNSQVTEEQKEFISDFTKPTLSLSDPGTGKTHATTLGILIAQKVHKVKGNRIRCMSYTREASAEIAARYTRFAKAIGTAATAEFSTVHSFMLEILREAYPDMKIEGQINRTVAIPRIADIAKKYTGYCSNEDAATIFRAMDSLNTRLVFSDSRIQENYYYKIKASKLVTPEVLNKIRKTWLTRCLVTRTITQGDIPIYTLLALLMKPELVEKYKKKYDILIVDEFQDLTPMYFKALSMITDTLICIGDMKQQIYDFNGSTPNICEEYKSVFPNARICPLTQSFRCSNAIAEKASEVLNDTRENGFKGCHDRGVGVTVSKLQGMQHLDQMCEDIKEGFEKKSERRTMFLCRNRPALYPIMDRLYINKIPFYSANFKTIWELPILSELFKIVNFAGDYYDPDKAYEFVRMLPETWKTPDFFKLIKNKRGNYMVRMRSIYKWCSSQTILDFVEGISSGIKAGALCHILFNNALQVFDKYIIKGNWWRFAETPEDMFRLVEPILRSRTFKELVAIEQDKQASCLRNLAIRAGVHCSTIHSAKGLEADDVYILDADDTVLPSRRAWDSYIRADASSEGMTFLQNEKNLLYVGITRAKENCFIYYRERPSLLIYNAFEPPEGWDYEAKVYELETKAFKELMEGGVK